MFGLNNFAGQRLRTSFFTQQTLTLLLPCLWLFPHPTPHSPSIFLTSLPASPTLAGLQPYCVHRHAHRFCLGACVLTVLLPGHRVPQISHEGLLVIITSRRPLRTTQSPPTLKALKLPCLFVYCLSFLLPDKKVKSARTATFLPCSLTTMGKCSLLTAWHIIGHR